MRDLQRHLDAWSGLVILITFLMFVAALLLKGLGHDLLLEGGVFLVSVKLVMMAYKNSVTATKLIERVDELQSTLARIEGALVESSRLSELAARPLKKASQERGAIQHADEAGKGSRARG